MKIAFNPCVLRQDRLVRLQQINGIIAEYLKLGLKLTLRQLYYQLVSRDIIPNKQTEYAKLSDILKEGRMCGIVDWSAIEDRLRTVQVPASWNTPGDVMQAAINSFEMPRQKGQNVYIEVWVEKDALSGVLLEVTEPYHIPVMVNRGYSSASAIFDSYKRFRKALEAGQQVLILYLGDYDPSGVDMIRDVYDRPLEMLLAKADDIMDKQYSTDDFEALHNEYFDDDRTMTEDDSEDRTYFDPYKAMILDRFKVQSIALTREQITQYNPPPNPAKRADPRAADFIAKHGTQSWEVDALRPEVLNALLTQAIESRIDLDKYNVILEEEKAGIAKLENLKNKL